MALTLTQAEADVRVLTRHVSDTTRLTQAVTWGFLNKEYRKLRSWLIDIAPQLYLATSGDITMPDPTTGQEVELESASFQYEKLYRVDQLNENGDETFWMEVERAHPTNPNYHQSQRVTWREEGGCLIFGPDNEVEGTFRILFYATPPELTVGASTFLIPHQLEDALRYGTCAKIALADGDSPKEWMDLYKDELKMAMPELAKRYGVHSSRAGLRKLLPY